MLDWLRYGAGWWLGFLPLYLLFAGRLDWQEFVAAAVLSALAALALTASCHAGRLHFQPRLRWLGHFRRLPGKVLSDSVLVGVALTRALRGERVEGTFRTIPFDPGGDDAESAARRALVMAGLCLAPNTYVVAIDRERGELLVHQLVPTPEQLGEGNREWPL